MALCAGVSTRRGLAGAPDMCGQLLLAAGVAAVEIVTAVNGPTSDVETGAFIRCSRACRHRKVRLLADARAAEGDRHSRYARTYPGGGGASKPYFAATARSLAISASSGGGGSDVGSAAGFPASSTNFSTPAGL